MCNLPAHDLGYCLTALDGALLFVLIFAVAWVVMWVEGRIKS